MCCICQRKELEEWPQSVPISVLNNTAFNHMSCSSYLLYSGPVRFKIPSVRDVEAMVSQVIWKFVTEIMNGNRMADKTNVSCRDRIHVNVGDAVLLQHQWQNKLDSMFHPEPFSMVAKNNNQVYVQSSDGTVYRRNVQQVKPFHSISQKQRRKQQLLMIRTDSTQMKLWFLHRQHVKLLAKELMPKAMSSHYSVHIRKGMHQHISKTMTWSDCFHTIARELAAVIVLIFLSCFNS